MNTKMTNWISSVKPNKREVFWAFLILTIYNFWHLFYMLTSKGYPSGDGTRIFPFVEFVQQSSYLYPQWNPYKSGGLPLIADPERFVFLSWVLPSSDNILFYNFLYVFGAAGLSFALFLLARQLNISFLSSIIGGLLITSTQFFFLLIRWGRIEQLYANIAVLLSMYLCLKLLQDKERWCFGALAIVIGFVLQAKGYYAATYLFPLLLVSVIHSKSKGLSWRDFILGSVSPIFIAGLLGIGLATFWVLPVLDYSSTSYVSISPKDTLLSDQPIFYSIINIFFPVLNMLSDKKEFGRVFFFISPLIFPLLLIYLAVRKERIWEYEKLFLFLLSMGLFFCLGELPGFNSVISWWSNAPFINNIRFTASFQWLIMISLIMFSMAGLDRFYSISNIARSRLFVFILLFTVVLCVFFYLYGSIDKAVTPVSTKFHILIAFILALVFAIAFNHQKLLIFVSLSLIIFQASYLESYTDYDKTSGQNYFKSYMPVLSSDKGNSRASLIGRKTGLPKIRNIAGFSMYFSDENRAALEMLYGGDYKNLGRPHWINIPPLINWNPFVIDMLNLKFIEIGEKEYKKFKNRLSADWDLVAGEHRRVLLKKKEWKSSLKIFDSWSFVHSQHSAVNGLLANGFREKLFVEGKGVLPGIDEIQLLYGIEEDISDDQHSVFQVETNKSSMLFVPEYFDRYWKVRVNGQLSQLFRANGCCRAVQLGEGKHIVTMTYEPKSYYIGLVISLLVLSGIFIYCFMLGIPARIKNLMRQFRIGSFTKTP
jgi:hypothetical protein